MNRIIQSLLHGEAGKIIPILPAPAVVSRRATARATPADDMMSADSRKLYEAWQNWRGDRLLPRRGEMDLVSISRLMPRLAVIDVKAPDSALFRLAGTEIEYHFGERLTGRSYIRMVPADLQPRRGELLWRIATQPCAVMQHVACDWQSGRHGVVEVFGVPVLPDRDGGPVQMLGVISRLPPVVWDAKDRITTLRSVTMRFIDIGAGVPAL